MHRTHAGAAGVAAVVVVVVLGACTPSSPSPEPTSSPAPATASASASASASEKPDPSPAPTASASAAAPTPSPTLTPGAPCDPAAGSPDCTDATGADDGRFLYIEGYADCVAYFTTDERYGLCTDLDGDGRAGYPDSG